MIKKYQIDVKMIYTFGLKSVINKNSIISNFELNDLCFYIKCFKFINKNFEFKIKELWRIY